ncbi:chemotaxis protein CheC [Methanomicrobium sp. W14]|uniref:chemotaxis protein CheC n=1 Tax=Methanomicrobium sp. W14 TaxID=2817839 RepID=UPI0032AF753A|nr:chemotaxis protein CheC [Methanomicrobium sp. W14]
MVAEHISEEDVDAIKEILNIGIGRSAQMLNNITKSHILLSIPQVKIYNAKTLQKGVDNYLDENSATVKLEFSGVFSGITAVAFPKDSATKLVMVITGEEAELPELDSIRIETLKEVGNIIINGVMGSISNFLSTHLDYTLPLYEEGSIIDMLKSGKKVYDEQIIMAVACFKIKDLDIEGNIFMILEIGSMKILLKDIRNM